MEAQSQLESLTCSICCMKYDKTQREASILPCGHTFCLACIRDFRNKSCPKCREDFLDNQVKKNFDFHALVEEMDKIVPAPKQETCRTHKREVDRFCRSCEKLMCSVCSCKHLGSETDILSDINLREEVQTIAQGYMRVEQIKRNFDQKIKDHMEEIKTNQNIEEDKVTKSYKAQIKKAREERDAAVKAAEEQANRKIQEIEANKLKLIKKVNNDANSKIKDIESKSVDLFKKMTLENNSKIDQAIKAKDNLKQKVDTLQDLSKFGRDTLSQCQKIYKLEREQRTKLQKLVGLSQDKIDSILEFALKRPGMVIQDSGEEGTDSEEEEDSSEDEDQGSPRQNTKRFKVGEEIDCLDTEKKWLNAEIIKLKDNQVFVHYTGWSNKWDEWIDVNSKRLLKQWRHGHKYQINNRIDVLFDFDDYDNDDSDCWHEARIIKIDSRNQKIKIHYKTLVEKDEWINMNSRRIAEVGTRGEQNKK